MTRDFADPTKDFFSFLLYETVKVKCLEIYFCFMNVEKTGQHNIQKKLKYIEDDLH